MVRAVPALLVALSLCLAASPALGDQPVASSISDSRVWWVQAAAEEAPEKKLHLLPDGTEEPRDWLGLARDTGFLIGYQGVALGVLALLPESVSAWNGHNKDVSFDKWWHNVQNPVWDHDAWPINYIGHPYFGAVYYIRARERGFDRIDAFLYSAIGSAIYEFGIEAFFEPPSYQDLIVTPVGGALLGGLVFEPIRSWARRRPEPRWYHDAILMVTDPLGALNYVAERLIGIKSDIRVTVPRRGGVAMEFRVVW